MSHRVQCHVQVIDAYIFLDDPDGQSRDLALAFTRIMNESILQTSKEVLVVSGALDGKPRSNLRNLKDVIALLLPHTFPDLMQRVRPRGWSREILYSQHVAGLLRDAWPLPDLKLLECQTIISDSYRPKFRNQVLCAKRRVSLTCRDQASLLRFRMQSREPVHRLEILGHRFKNFEGRLTFVHTDKCTLGPYSLNVRMPE